MEQTSVDMIYDIATDVLETQAFAFVEPCEKDDWQNHPTTEFIYASIEYAGPTEGSLNFVISQNGGAEIAANLLGLEPYAKEAEECAPDAVGEMLNVICGQYLTTQFGTSSVFNLSIPECEFRNHQQLEDTLNQDDIALFFVDDEPACVVAPSKDLTP